MDQALIWRLEPAINNFQADNWAVTADPAASCMKKAGPDLGHGEPTHRQVRSNLHDHEFCSHDAPREIGSINNIHNPASNPCLSKQTEEPLSPKHPNHTMKYLLLFFPPTQREESLKVISNSVCLGGWAGF